MNASMLDLVEKSAIRDVLSRYCRSLDRMDKETAYGVFAADATVQYYGIFQGTGHGFIDWVWGAHLGMTSHSHQITNVLIEFDADSAVSESYVAVVLQQQRATDAVEIQVRGRYLDRWSKRAGRWLIVDREYVTDTQAEIPLSATSKSLESRRDRSDVSFKFFP